MTVRELLKELKKEAKKEGILDREIWESPSRVRCKNSFLIASRIGEIGAGLEHFEIGFKHGAGKELKAFCKKY